MKKKFIRLIDKLLGPAIRNHYDAPSMEWSFRNMRRLGFDPKFIVDVGAFNGEWTAMALAEFPEAIVLMLEAQENKRQIMESLTNAGRGRIYHRIAAMGAKDGEKVVFHEYEHAPTASSMLRDHASAPARNVETSLRTLDSILAADNFPQPDLIKLDVQGYELEVLKGAESALAGVEALLMEVSIVELYQNNPVLHHVTSFMAERGFRAYDICSLLRRPLDRALCQIDIIFVKETSRYFQQKAWD